MASSPEAVMLAYAERINAHDFDLLVPVIAEDAIFWFSSGSFVGLAAVRAAFEATWQRLANETYWLEDLHWLGRGDAVASCTYRFRWTATVDGQPQAGGGRGTTVLAQTHLGWQIVHEHLSREPG